MDDNSGKSTSGWGGLAAGGADDGEGAVVFTHRQSREREDAVAEDDLDVDTLAHRQVDRFGLPGLDGEAVGVGDGHAVTTEGHLEDGVTAGVDKPQAGLVARVSLEGPVSTGDTSVDEVVRIHHIAGIPAQYPVRGAVHHMAVASHPLLPVMVARTHSGELVELIVGSALNAIDPVVEHDGPLDVLVLSVLWVTDDQWGVEAAIKLQAGVGMVEVGATVGDFKNIGERLARFNGVLGHAGHTVGCVVECDAMPVDGGALRQFIGDIDLEDIAGGGLNGRIPGVRDVSPRLGFDTADIQREGPSGQCPAHRRLTERSGGGSGAKRGTWCRGSGSRVAGAGGHGPGAGEDEPTEQKLSSRRSVHHD